MPLSRAAVWIAQRAPSGLWGPFAPTGGLVQFDAHGVAIYQARYATPTWIAIRIYLPAGSPGARDLVGRAASALAIAAGWRVTAMRRARAMLMTTGRATR